MKFIKTGVGICGVAAGGGEEGIGAGSQGTVSSASRAVMVSLPPPPLTVRNAK